MKKITEITADASQKFRIIGENREEIIFKLEYRPTQYAWYFSVEFEDFFLNGCKLCHYPNILRQYKNILPFGIMCLVPDGTEPFFIDDFVKERVNIFLLTESEVEEVEEIFK